MEIAKKEGADAIAHGCTGKGNDQVRFELAIKAFAPNMGVIAPWRTWEMKSRDEEIDYAEKKGIPLNVSRETSYSKDKNLWHLSHEGLDLEDPGNEPDYDKILELGVSPEKAPDKPTYVTLHFEKGIPTALDGKKMKALDIITALNQIGGRQRYRSCGHGGEPAGGYGSPEAYTKRPAAPFFTRPMNCWKPFAWIGIPSITNNRSR